MKLIKALSQDVRYQINLKLYDGCYEYCLTDTNDSDEIYAILEESELNEDI